MMAELACLAAGTLLAIGIYLLTERDVFRRILGVVCLSHAANVAMFVTGAVGAAPTFVGPDGVDPAQLANPLPQALVLTAIVIGLCVVTLLAAIAYGRTPVASEPPGDEQ
jgi:multicomponent Na+:H+ antiporter subunit C